MANVAVKSFEFWVAMVYVPHIIAQRVSFYRWLMPFLDPKWIVLVGDWNAILDSKIDRIRRGASRLGRYESSLIDFIARHDLVDRFSLDHLGREMWTWLDSSPSVHAGSYLDRVIRADTDVMCLTFHYVRQTDHRLVRVSLQQANSPSLASYWRFNTSLLKIRDFWDRMESQIQQALPELGGGYLLNIGLEISPSNTVVSST